MSKATLHIWKAKHGGLDVSREASEALEDESAKLKRLLADAMLDAATLKELLEKAVGLAAKCARAGAGCGGAVGLETQQIR